MSISLEEFNRRHQQRIAEQEYQRKQQQLLQEQQSTSHC